MRPLLRPVLAALTLLAAMTTALSAADAPAKKKILIITGHDVKALSNPAVRTLILRGTAWAAGDLK